MSLRRRARDWSLLFCAAIACFLLSVLLSARLGVWLAARLQPSSVAGRLLLAVAVLDLLKAPALLAAARLLRPSLGLGPTTAAAGLVGLTYLLEVGVGAALGQLGWLSEHPGALAARLAAAVLLALLARQLLRRPPTAAAPGPYAPGPDALGPDVPGPDAPGPDAPGPDAPGPDAPGRGDAGP